MKKIFLSLCFLTSFTFAQNTVTDYDGNSYNYLSYGAQQWTIQNAAMETYSDGTPIPQVTSQSAWTSLTTGAWCYANNNSANTKLYNWYAVAGIHDNDPNTSTKELAPEGWHIPTDAEWTNLEEFLIANGYNYDGSSTGNKIAKAMASTTGWSNSTALGVPGNTQASNNSTNLAFESSGYRHGLYGTYTDQNQNANFWASDQSTFQNPNHPLELYSWVRTLKNNESDLIRYDNEAKDGFSVRFVQDSDSCSEVSITASETEVCAGVSVDLTAISPLAAGSTACTSADLPANLQNGLVGYWPFCGNANDASGNGNNGTVTGPTLTSDRLGNSNNAYSFDGSLDEYIVLSSNNIPSSGDFSVAFWINMQSYYLQESDNVEFINLGSQDDTKWGIASNISGDARMNYGKGCNDSGGNSISEVFNLNNWDHFIFVTNNINTQIFKNGVLVGTTENGTSSDCSTTNLYFGTDIFSNQENTEMILDNVAIWDRALTTNEIQQIANDSTFSWSTGDTTQNILVTPTETTDYWVDVTTNGVTCREYITISVTAPAAPTGDSEQTFCEASSIADLSVTGENLQWYDASIGGNLLDSTIALADGQVVYASQTANGCESTDRLEVRVSIQDINITASATEVCAGDSVDLTATSALAAGSTACTSADLTANLQNGLAGYWPFCGNANDESDNGNNGTVNGATLTTDRFGITNSAYEFTIVDSYINAGNDSLLQFDSDFSYSVYFNVNEITSSLLGGDPGSNIILNNEGIFELGIDINGNLAFAISTQDPTWSWINISTTSINEWYHLIFVYQQGLIKIFLNGSLVYSYLGSDVLYDFHPGLNDLRFGDRQLHETLGNDTSSFNGKIDDVTLWDRALTTTEIQYLANNFSVTWSTGDTTETISVTPIETTEYWVDVTTNGVTCREYITINVNDLPDAPTGEAENYFIYCDTFSPTLESVISTLTGDNIQFYGSEDGGDLLDVSSLIYDGQIVYASQSVGLCESSERFEVILNLYVLDNPFTDAPNNTVSFCNLENLTILNLAPAQTATSRLWYETEFSTTPIPETTLLVDGATYYVTNYDPISGCESDRLAMSVLLNTPAAPTGDSVQSFCDVSTIADLTVTGDTIQWYDSATGGILLDDTTVLIDGQLVYASQTENDCESLDRLGVSVVIDIITDPILITTELDFCLAREATLADLEIDAQGFELEWYDSYTGGTLLGLDTILEDAISYYATLYDVVSGCESLMRLEVIPTVIPCEVIIYNAISINDNGLNDYMVIENAEYFPFNTLEIFNRDGYLVYNQRKYGVGDNLFRGMANVGGIYSQGSNLPTGSYLYVFTYYNPYEQQEFVKKGFLTINNN